MLAVRPTFSESWYRVKNLKAKLRSSAEISRQYYRGDRWYVVRDPAGNQYHRLSDAAYRFVGLLDGSRTVEQAWDLAGGQLADDAPTQPEVIQILTHLYSANLIDADVTPDATVLLRRQKKQQQRKLQGRLMNVLFPRIPVWDPDRFLVRWMPIVRIMFSKLGALVWLVVLIAALASVVPHWDRVQSAAAHSIDMHNNPWNAFWLWLVFVLIKFIHELGHAFSCRRFGGECHEMGIMFLVFIPTPYVDASTAWSFPNKWHRIFVGAAGMIVEMFVAAICAFIWLATDPSSLPNQLAYNAMLVASVTTVIFNANPLLRYDGYYILSDLLEIPNLRQKSSEYAMGLIKRHVFRVKQQQPLPSIRQRIELFTYAVTSTVYRTIVGIVIILVVTWQVPVLGVLMALGGLATWLIVPSFKLFKYLALEPELHRKRGRAVAFCSIVAAVIVVAIGVLRFGVYIDQPGIVEPFAKQMVIPRSGGWVTEIAAQDGQPVEKGQLIMRLKDDELAANIAKLEARLGQLKEHQRWSAVNDQAQNKIDLDQIESVQDSLVDYYRQRDDLELKAPIAGVLVAPDLHNMKGVYLQRGQQLGQISAPGPLVVRTALEQKDYEMLRDSSKLTAFAKAHVEADRVAVKDSPIEVRVAGKVGTVLKGVQLLTGDAAQPELPHPSLGQAGGYEIATDPKDQSGRRPLVQQFEARVVLDATDAQYWPGQRATVRFKLEERPLISEWTRRFLQLVKTHQTSTWL